MRNYLHICDVHPLVEFTTYFLINMQNTIFVNDVRQVLNISNIVLLPNINTPPCNQKNITQVINTNVKAPSQTRASTSSKLNGKKAATKRRAKNKSTSVSNYKNKNIPVDEATNIPIVSLPVSTNQLAHAHVPATQLAHAQVASTPAAHPKVTAVQIKYAQPPNQKNNAHGILTKKNKNYKGAKLTNQENTTPIGPLVDTAQIRQIAKEIDSTTVLNEDVQNVLQDFTNDFVDNIINQSIMLAKHRKGTTLQKNDIQLALQRFDLWVPGFGTKEPEKHKCRVPTEIHKERLKMVRNYKKK